MLPNPNMEMYVCWIRSGPWTLPGLKCAGAWSNLGYLDLEMETARLGLQARLDSEIDSKVRTLNPTQAWIDALRSRVEPTRAASSRGLSAVSWTSCSARNKCTSSVTIYPSPSKLFNHHPTKTRVPSYQARKRRLLQFAQTLSSGGYHISLKNSLNLLDATGEAFTAGCCCCCCCKVYGELTQLCTRTLTLKLEVALYILLRFQRRVARQQSNQAEEQKVTEKENHSWSRHERAPFWFLIVRLKLFTKCRLFL